MRKRFVPNQEQRPVVEAMPTRPIFVQAGAGSGKTATLTERVVNALSGASNDGVPTLGSLDELLVVTFTENAATEVKERIRTELNACGMYEEAAQVDSAWISTIHSMCHRILTENAVDIGLDPEFDLMTEDSQKSRSQGDAVERAVTKIARSEQFVTLLAEFDLTQSSWDGRESDGSIQGMLTSIVEKATLSPQGMEALVTPDATPDSLRWVSNAFERQAESSLVTMRQVVASSRRPAKTQCARIESLELVERDIHAIAADIRASSLSDVHELGRICTRIEGLTNLSTRKLLGTQYIKRGTPFREAVDLVNARYSHLRAEAHTLRAMMLLTSLIDLARSTIQEADDMKDEMGVLDQDDLLRRVHDAFSDPDSIVAQRNRGRFKMVMVDEFQDTSVQQAEILRFLAADDDTDSSSAHTLATVGDPQQSIYRFRGADVNVMLHAKEEAMRDPGHMVATMSTNYRSHPDILDYVQAVCDDGGNGHGLLPDFTPLAPDPNRSDDFADIDERVLTEAYEYGYGEEMPNLEDARLASAESIARRFQWFIEETSKRKIKKSMALLLGAMTHVDIYASALKSAGVPYVITGGSIFSKMPEVQTMAELLQVIADAGNTKALYHVLASELFLAGDDDFLALHVGTSKRGTLVARSMESGLMGDWAEGMTVPPTIGHAKEILLRAFEEAKSLPLSVVCENVIRRSGWLGRLAEQGTIGRMKAANIMSALRHIREIVDDAGYGPVRGAKAFAEWLAMAKEPPATLAGGDDNPVQIMTIHASKGLQFSCVAVAELNQETTMSYRGLQLAPNINKIRVTLVPAERDRSGRSKKVGPGMYDWEKRDVVLKNFADDLELIDDGTLGGLAYETLEWRRQARDDEEAEQGRKLYVALTRAEDFLMMTMLFRANSGKARAITGRHSIGQQDYAPIYPHMADCLLAGIDAATENNFVDGDEPEYVYRKPEPLIDLSTGEPITGTDGSIIYQRQRLEPHDDHIVQFGKSSFGRCHIRREFGQQLASESRPAWYSMYGDPTVMPVKVTFSVSQDPESEET